MAMSTRRFWAALHLGGLSVREVAVRTWKRMNEHEILTRAAAIAFYAIAALVPFLALVITLTAYLLPSPVRQAVSGTAQAAGPTDELLDRAPRRRGLARRHRRSSGCRRARPPGLISFGLVATLWLSSSLFVAIMDAMNRILGVARVAARGGSSAWSPC